MRLYAVAMLKRFTVWISDETKDKLAKIAAKHDRSVGWLLRKAAEEYVEKHKGDLNARKS
jgi:predicted transcriptional regulator